MILRCGLMLLLLALWGPLASAGELYLYFDFPRDVTVDSFLFTYRHAADPGGVLQQFRVAWTAEPTCAVLGNKATPDTFCARPPGCLPPGIYSFSVQAERGTETSAPSNWTSCEALPNCAYNCTKFDEANAALEMVANGQDVPAPAPSASPLSASPPLVNASAETGATLQELEQQLTALDQLLPKPPATPVLATPPT